MSALRPRTWNPPTVAIRLVAAAAAAWQLGCGGYGNATAAASGGTGGGEAFVPAQHRAWPQMEKVGDGVMKSPRVVLILPDNESPLGKSRFADFVDAMPASEWYAAWTPGVGVGAARPSRTIPGPPLDSPEVDDTQAVAYVDAALAAAADPTLDPDGETVYVVTFPLGVHYFLETEPRVLGRHLAYGKLGDGWAFAQRFDVNDTIDQVTAVISHEVAEAITNTDANGWQVRVPPGGDPWDGSSWAVQEGVDVDGNGYLENGDFCSATNFKDAEGRFFQRIYDNAAAAAGADPCVPAISDPYFNLSTSQDWYTVEAGGSLDIDLTGWATADTSEFQAIPTGFAFGFDGGTYQLEVHRSSGFDTFNNGTHGTLHVTVPAGAASGGWALFTIWTEGLSLDDFHLFTVGLHVP